MTLSELLHSVTFDDIIPFIRNFEDGNRCIALYKMHYDYLYHLTPTKNGDEIKKATVSCIPADDYHESRFYAYPLNEDRWEDSVAKELIIEPDVDGSNAEIAACCLWHTSYHGFTKQQLSEPYDTEYEIQKTKEYLSKYEGHNGIFRVAGNNSCLPPATLLTTSVLAFYPKGGSKMVFFKTLGFRGHKKTSVDIISTNS